MCGRFVISSKNAYGLKYDSSYNITPSQLIPVKTKFCTKLMKWSYSPSWKKDLNLINCRSETMHEKPSFKYAKRCVIYHNGWYEWQRKNKLKIPVLLEDSEVSLYLNGKNIFNSDANHDVSYHPVSKNVNNPLNNNSSLVQKVNI